MKALISIVHVYKLKCCLFVEFAWLAFSPTINLFSSVDLQLGSNLQESEDESPCDKLGAIQKFGCPRSQIIRGPRRPGDR